MSRTVADLKTSVSGLLQGTDLSNVTDLNGAFQRAARVLAQYADVPEASGKEAITLYDGVTEYAAPETIFGGTLNDLRQQGVSRNEWDEVYKVPIRQFDRTKAILPNGTKVTFEWDKGTPILRVASAIVTPRALLDPMNDDDDWTAAGSASGLMVDETVYYQAPAALRFLLTGASTGTLTKTITSVDLDTYEDVCVGFLAIRTPSITNLTSIAVRVGSSAAVYDQVSTTEGFLGAWVVDEWLLVAFDFSGATSTGTPDWNAITYLQVRVTHSGTITNFRVGGFWLSLPSPHDLLFQSAAIFKVSGVLSNIIADDNDVIILSDSAYTLYEYECAEEVYMASGGSRAAPLMQGLMTKKEKLYTLYRADNPSQEIREVGNYYE